MRAPAVTTTLAPLAPSGDANHNGRRRVAAVHNQLRDVRPRGQGGAGWPHPPFAWWRRSRKGSASRRSRATSAARTLAPMGMVPVGVGPRSRRASRAGRGEAGMDEPFGLGQEGPRVLRRPLADIEGPRGQRHIRNPYGDLSRQASRMRATSRRNPSATPAVTTSPRPRAATAYPSASRRCTRTWSASRSTNQYSPTPACS